MSIALDVYDDVLNQTVTAEREIKALQADVESLKQVLYDRSGKPVDVQALITENTKLKYRVNILKKAVSAQLENMNTASDSCMINIQQTLEDLFLSAVKAAYPDIVDVAAPVSLAGNNPKFGDYQCNAAMPICQHLKSQGVKASPRDIGNNIVQHCPKSDLIEKLEVAGPGFINITLNTKFLGSQINDLVSEGVRAPSMNKKRVVVDFSSPNVAKEMHVGHLRSTIIGDSICRLLEFLGHDVLRINHIGDWGTQFGMLIAHLQDKYPNFTTESPPIQDLQAFYKESKKRFDEDADFKKRAYSCVVKLQAHEPEYIQAWTLICDVSRRAFQEIYQRLDVHLEERGESFYQHHMVSIVNDLDTRGLLELDEGRKIMWCSGCPIPFTMVKSDGGYTYDTSDMATLRQRLQEEKADWLIYVTDAGQATHFDILFRVGEHIGLLDRNTVRCDHVGFGVVLGGDKKKFKTRSGDTVRLVDLLDEGLKRALDKLQEKGRHEVLTPEELKAAQESVAYGCIKYSDLSHNRKLEYIFSFDKMLEDKGNTAVYLLYAFTRIRSIARVANVTSEQIREAAKKTTLTLEHEKEIKLAKVLLRFPEVIQKVIEDLFIHSLCEYQYDISTTFSEFYDNCYCVEKDRTTGEVVKIHMHRLILCEATASVMDQIFKILGVKPVPKM